VTAQTAPSDRPSGSSATASIQAKPQLPFGGIEVLSDTEGIDLKPYLQQWRRITDAAWQPSLSKQAGASTDQPSAAAIRFKILPNGKLMDGSVVLEERSGQASFDRTAWDAIAASNYPPLPKDFNGPYLELRTNFLYNMQPEK
jgi:TonB C terminal